ncbi:MAG: hypothetical protein Q7S21_04715 [archaeon]|nr:hypothetical protein [archaeon]
MKISEDKMISEFLKAEINSKRFGKKILNALRKRRKTKRIVLSPNLKDKKENQYRKQLLGIVRGFGKNKDLFENFPKKVKWEKGSIKKSELKKVKFIDYSYWNELSNNTRTPTEAAKNVKSGVKAFNVSNRGFYQILSEIKKGKKLPLIIFVAKNKKSRIVVLEGNARLTAYFLEPKYLPNKMEVIIGYSKTMQKWGLY